MQKNLQSKYNNAKVVAEIGCNHKGDLALAKSLILSAKQCGVDYAKFQKRNAKALLTQAQYDAPHNVPYHAYGNTYGAHREFLEFSSDQHRELKSYCEELGIGYACSVWDLISAKDIIDLNPDYIKVPSACNNNHVLLYELRDNYKGSVHISLGMTSLEEEKEIMSLFSGHEERLVLYACTSGYPVRFDDVCLMEIRRLVDAYGDSVESVAFSGHHLGIAIDIAAYVLGAQWIERHFTGDRTWKGTDHAASLEASGLGKLVRDLQATHSSLQYKSNEILEVEQEQRNKLKYRKS